MTMMMEMMIQARTTIMKQERRDRTRIQVKPMMKQVEMVLNREMTSMNQMKMKMDRDREREIKNRERVAMKKGRMQQRNQMCHIQVMTLL